MAKTAQTKLRPLIHPSYGYLLNKFYDSEPYPVIVSVKTLQDILKKVADAVAISHPGECPWESSTR